MGTSAWVALGLTLICACGSSNDEATDTHQTACIPGQSVACAGPASCDGYQTCDEDGSGYGACQCGSGTSSVGNTGNTNGSTPSSTASGASFSRGGSTANAVSGGSSSSGNASGGSSVSIASGGTAAVSSGGSGAGCQPSSMVGWIAPAYVPARAKQSVCTDTQIQNYLGCLRGGNCTEYAVGAPGEACGKCLAPSPIGDKSWGPLIEVLPSPFYRWETNFSGCVELLGGTSCAPKLQAASTCASESCAASCGASSPSYDTCVAQARTSTCNAYAQQATCITDATMASRCSGTSFDSSVVAVARVFCGNQ